MRGRRFARKVVRVLGEDYATPIVLGIPSFNTLNKNLTSPQNWSTISAVNFRHPVSLCRDKGVSTFVLLLASTVFV